MAAKPPQKGKDMYKTDFYIAISGTGKDRRKFSHYDKKSGWGETLSAPDGTAVEIRYNKTKSGTWTATEASTGFGVPLGVFESRSELKRNISPDILRAIVDMLRQPSSREHIERLTEYTTDHPLTVR